MSTAMKKQNRIILSIIVALAACSMFWLFLQDHSTTLQEKDTITYNPNMEVYMLLVEYDSLNVGPRKIEIDFREDEMRFTIVNDNITTLFKFKDSKRMIAYLKNYILFGNWNGEMVELPDGVEAPPAPGGENLVLRRLWRIGIYGTDGWIYFSDFEKYPSFWYELIDLICEEAGTTTYALDIH